ncbi:hypothetical protein OE88DRAFT_281798 [Heliocybe sulcata]|uniref:F-box domain-containing protein n=1 Tax=Heliocybe sulcata TaxID=5364 RepID=A0A5C3N0T2_9AGAM|nr:hypothetical protein OE88DRAFT_281798 [Heliocybe sulcata]
MSVPELPDELLLAIFKHFDPLVLANYCVPELVDITHVCHRWREIAVGTPELWSNIYIFHLTNKNLPLEVILRRSQHLPLKCQIYANIEVQPRKLLMRASERIETLKIKAPKCVLTRLIHLPIGPLPLLRVLEIIEKEDRTGLTDSEETLDSEQFLELFAASELTELNLDGRSFTNIEPVLQPSLTRLTLCNRYFTVDYILKALTQMPLLRFFYLSGDLPSSRSDSLRHYPQICIGSSKAPGRRE